MKTPAKFSVGLIVFALLALLIYQQIEIRELFISKNSPAAASDHAAQDEYYKAKAEEAKANAEMAKVQTDALTATAPMVMNLPPSKPNYKPLPDCGIDNITPQGRALKLQDGQVVPPQYLLHPPADGRGCVYRANYIAPGYTNAPVTRAGN